MSLSASAAEWQPTPTPAPDSIKNPVPTAIPTQAVDAPKAHSRGGGQQRVSSHPPSSHRGGGRGRGAPRGGSSTSATAALESQDSSRANSDPTHHQHTHTQQHNHTHAQSQRGGANRGGGGSNGNGRGGSVSRGGRGGRGGHSAPYGGVSAADAAAIDAALNDIPPSTMPHTNTRSNSASSSSTATSEQLRMQLFKYEKTTLQESRFINKPKHYPKGKPPTFDKNQYMQANHAFALGQDVPASFLLPDHPLSWDKVELVVCPVDTEARTCPICLSEPVAATITRCGHVYCICCILHYLSLSDRNWSRCPLCFEAVYPQALKSAEFRVQHRVNEGATVEFVLMRRFKDCVNASPVSSSVVSDPSVFSRISLLTDLSPIVHRELRELFDLRAACRAAKDDFTLTYIDRAEATIVKRIADWAATHPHWQMTEPTYDQMKAEETHKYAAEEADKRRQAEKAASILATTEAWPELPPAKIAKHPSVTRPLTNTPGAANPSSSSSSSSSPAASMTVASSASPVAPAAATATATFTAKSSSFFDPHEAQAEYKFNKKKAQASAMNDTLQDPTTGESSTQTFIPNRPHRPGQTPHSHATTMTADQTTPPPTQAPTPTPSSESTYYFYQSCDGRQLYLHSLNFRSLLLTYNNDLHSLPPRLVGKVQHCDSYVIDRTIRDKFRFLSHLPLTASFGLALVDLGNQVSKEAIEAIRPEFEADRRARQAAKKQQKELNKRSKMSSKALAQFEHGGSSSSASSLHAASWPGSDDSIFPDLNPLGLATAAVQPTPTDNAHSMKPNSGSPALRPNNWNVIAEKGMGSSELWPTLEPPIAIAAAAGSHWGAAAAPIGTTTAGGWGKSNPSKPTQPVDDLNQAEESLPPPSRNRKGQTVLLASTGRRGAR